MDVADDHPDNGGDYDQDGHEHDALSLSSAPDSRAQRGIAVWEVGLKLDRLIYPVHPRKRRPPCQIRPGRFPSDFTVQFPCNLHGQPLG
jgi:hypothetical protein